MHGFARQGSAFDGKLDTNIRPSPRISRMKGNLAASLARPARNSSPRARMFASSFSSSMMLQKFESRGASQRSAAEGGAVHSGEMRRATASLAEDGAERKASGERFGDDDDIRLR